MPSSSPHIKPRTVWTFPTREALAISACLRYVPVNPAKPARSFAFIADVFRLLDLPKVVGLRGRYIAPSSRCGLERRQVPNHSVRFFLSVPCKTELRTFGWEVLL